MNCKKGEVSHHLACDCREDAICKEVAGLRERLAASEKAREEAEKRAVEYVIVMNMAEEKLLAAESRAARLAEALAPFADPERYNTAEEECRENKAAMRWCAVHSFRWPCPVGPARAALAAEEGR